MLPAAICFLSVICTASLASFGMDVSVLVPSSSSSSSPREEDVARINAECTVFYEFFAAATIIVCIVYYVVFRITLSAMGAVAIRRRPSAESLVELVEIAHDDDDEEEEEAPPGSSEEDNEKEGDSAAAANSSNNRLEITADQEARPPASPISSISSFDFSIAGDDDPSSQADPPLRTPPSAAAASAAGAAGKTRKRRKRHRRPHARGAPASSSFSSAAAASASAYRLRDDRHRCSGEGKTSSSLRVWTNIYGLSVGVYCLVYSLLFPNELSALVFCIATLLITLQQVLSPFISAYVYDEMGMRHVVLGGGGNNNDQHHHRRNSGSSGMDAWNKFRRRFKRCVGWLCIFQDSIRHDIGQTIQDATMPISISILRRRRGASSSSSSPTSSSRRRSSVLRQCVRGGSMCVPVLIVIVGIGLGFKVMHMHECPAFSSSPPPRVRRDLPSAVNITEVSEVHDDDDNTTEEKNASWFLPIVATSTPRPSLEEATITTAVESEPESTPPPAAPAPPPWNMMIQEAFRVNASSSASRTISTTSAAAPAAATKTSSSLAGILTSILFPIVGVFMIRSMNTAENLLETMEVAVPAFGINSVCIACLIFLFNPACFRRHLSVVVTVDSAYWYDAAVSSLSPYANASSSPAAVHLTPSHNEDTILQIESIVSLMALPFPLVCSIVCIVAAGKNRRFMDIAAAVFLAYACRTHTALGRKRGCANGDDVSLQEVVVIQGLPPARSETIALGCAIAVCVLLMLHRLYWGDDYGIAYSEGGGEEQYEPVVLAERRTEEERAGLLAQASHEMHHARRAGERRSRDRV